MPRSIRFFAHNRWNGSIAVPTPIIGSSGERTDYEADMTQTMALAETWRSTGLSGAYITADLTTAYKIGAICLVRCNLTSNGLFKVRIGNTADFSTNLYDSGWVERRRYYSDAEIAIAKSSEFFPDGFPNSDMQKRIQRQILVVVLPSEVSARYIRIDFNDTANPDGYIEVAYVYAGKILEPTNDLMYGWKMQRDDFVRDGQAACGQYWPSSVYNKTLIALTMAPQSEVNLTNYWLLVEYLVGINQEFIVSLVQQTDSLLYTTTVYGKWSQVPSNQNVAFKTWAINMLIEEVVD